jgi:hypothetical protein
MEAHFRGEGELARLDIHDEDAGATMDAQPLRGHCAAMLPMGPAPKTTASSPVLMVNFLTPCSATAAGSVIEA